MNTIARIWNGNLAPAEGVGRNDPEIRELIQKMEQKEEGLKKTLNREQKGVYEECISCVDDYWSLMAEKAFCEGFALSTRLLAEAFMTNE